MNTRFFSLPLLLALGATGLPAAQPAAAPAGVFATTPDDNSALLDRARPAIVHVRAGDKGFIQAGTGFFIDGQGTILTSSTIIGENSSARVILNGVETDAKVIGNDPASGLAMLRVTAPDSPALPLGHTTDLKSGNTVTAIGFPLDLPAAASSGPVSGFDASYLGPITGKTGVAAVERFDTTHIHANTAISPGEVGGPLLNPRGEVVGMIATSPDDGASVYALPVEAMEKIISDFIQYGRARHGWVGVKFIQGPDTLHDGRTVRVVAVVPGTPAAGSGIRPGDTVMRIDSREIYRPDDVVDASFFSQVGGSMTVVVRRDTALYNYSFAVMERPATDSPPPGTRTTRTSPPPIDLLVAR